MPMKFLTLLAVSLLSACIHAPAPTVPTGEEISKTSGEAARKNLSEGSPALYSTSVPEKVEEPAPPPALAPIQVLVYPDGSFRMDGVAFSAEMLQTNLAGREDRGPLEFVAHKDVPYGKLVQALDVAKSLGYDQVALKPLPPVDTPSKAAP